LTAHFVDDDNEMWENESPNLSYTVEREEKNSKMTVYLRMFTFQAFQTWTFYRPKECGK